MNANVRKHLKKEEHCLISSHKIEKVLQKYKLISNPFLAE